MSETENSQEQQSEQILEIDEETILMLKQMSEKLGLSIPEVIHKAAETVDNFESRQPYIIFSEKRKTFNTKIAGYLALVLWAILGLTVLWHLGSTSFVYIRLWNDKNEIENALEKVDKSSSIINDTAKSLYAVIVPIAATVTAFYFDAKKKEQESEED